MKSNSRHIILFSLLVIVPVLAFGQPKVNWVSFEEAERLSADNPKKIMVDMYTDWCTYCKKMDSGPLCKENIINYINDNYYAVKFNAESKKNIEFNNQTYKYVKSGKNSYNELALELTRGRLSYPAIVFIDEDLNIIQAIHGYMPPDKLEKVMIYFSDDYFKTTPWVTFQRNFESSIKAKEVTQY